MTFLAPQSLRFSPTSNLLFLYRTDQDAEEVTDMASEDSSIDETDIDFLDDAEIEKDVFRTKTFMYVSDLARKSPRVLAKKSALYNWNLITIAIFYGLPVVQLVLTYQNVTNATGNQDMCYFNFMCAQPLGLVSMAKKIYYCLKVPRKK